MRLEGNDILVSPSGKYFKITSGGNKKYFHLVDSCLNCKKPFLAEKTTSLYCSVKCHTNGIANGFFGKKHSDKFKNKISEINSGKHIHKYGIERAKLISIKHSISISGKRHWNWQNCNNEYCEVWEDKEYKQDILDRDKRKCCNPQCISKNSNDLTIHHIDYNKKNCFPKNLLTLCRGCNSSANYNREWYKAFYTEVMRRKCV